MTSKPDCYRCLHRRNAIGSAHSRCEHPKAKEGLHPAAETLSMFGLLASGGEALGLDADMHGVVNGWFAWPFNFDPVWLRACSGFEAKETGEVFEP